MSGVDVRLDHPDRDIRFTKTEDGIDVAFWEIGEGKPVIILNNFGISHAELEWTVPSIASFYMEMARRYRVIRCDPRGIGLSGELPGGWGATTPSGVQAGMSTHEMGFDISAVASALGVDSFALMATSIQGPVAIEYAAKHLEVSELILCDSFATVATSWIAPTLRTQAAISKIEEREGGPVFTIWERIAAPDEVDQLVNLTRASDSRTQGVDYPGLSQLEWDAKAFLAEVSVPTLIVSSRSDLVDGLPDARQLAAGISGSQLRIVDGGFAPYWSDRPATLEAIDALLLGDTQSGSAEAGLDTVVSTDMVEAMSGGVSVIVFTDLVDSTKVLDRLGDEGARTAMRSVEELVSERAEAHSGAVIKQLGDGSLLEFASASNAIEFARKIQIEMQDSQLQLRIGMAAGEPIREAGDVHGAVVVVASRVCDAAGPGEVMVSEGVRQLLVGKQSIFQDQGEHALKGFDDPIRIWQLET